MGKQFVFSFTPRILALFLLALVMPTGMLSYASTIQPVPVQINSASILISRDLMFNVHVVAMHADGTIFAVRDVHNVLTVSGQSMVRCAIGQGQTANATCAPAKNIMLFNDTSYTPAATDTKCDPATQAKVLNKYGLAPVAGSFTATNNGAWTIGSGTLTDSVAAQTIYGSCLTTTTTISDVNLFAAATFTSITLQIGDQAVISWNLTAA